MSKHTLHISMNILSSVNSNANIFALCCDVNFTLWSINNGKWNYDQTTNISDTAWNLLSIYHFQFLSYFPEGFSWLKKLTHQKGHRLIWEMSLGTKKPIFIWNYSNKWINLTHNLYNTLITNGIYSYWENRGRHIMVFHWGWRQVEIHIMIFECAGMCSVTTARINTQQWTILWEVAIFLQTWAPIIKYQSHFVAVKM